MANGQTLSMDDIDSCGIGGSKKQTFEAGRKCKTKGCGCVLSVYNRAKYCNVCIGKRLRSGKHMPKNKLTDRLTYDIV